MRRFWQINFIATISLVFLSVPGYAQDATINGLGWLISAQQVDGSWGDQPRTAFRDTTTTADTFHLLDPTHPALVVAVQWLSTADPVEADYHTQTVTVLDPFNYDYSSRRLYTFALTGSDYSRDMTYLLSVSKIDGGWGLDVDHESDILDTALVLRGLVASQSADGATITGAVNYLLSNQNSDGGWGFAPGQDSHVYYTAVVMQALETQVQSAAIANALSRATAYLLSQQLSDGSWGNVPDTALAFMAINTTSGNVAARVAAVIYLIGQQQANGSWSALGGDDPYSTALALQALKASEPLQGDLDLDGDGYTPRLGDCNDSNAAVHPGAVDNTVDGIDQNCNGIDGPPVGNVDADNDGFTVAQGDCNDTNPAIHPGAVDIPGNGIDENCDGMDGVTAVQITALSLFKLMNGVQTPATSFGPYETVGISVTVNDPTAPLSLFVTDAAGQSLAVRTDADGYAFDTVNLTPGAYTVTAWALDATTGAVVDQAAAAFTITSGVNVTGGILAVIPGFTHVGATETITLAAQITNASNAAATFTIIDEIKTPSGAVIHSGSTTMSVGPEMTTSSATLAGFSYSFGESGSYPATAQVYNGSILLTTLTGSISAAPLVRIEPSLTVTPGTVLPDGDKRIHIDIHLEGVQETP